MASNLSSHSQMISEGHQLEIHFQVQLRIHFEIALNYYVVIFHHYCVWGVFLHTLAATVWSKEFIIKFEHTFFVGRADHHTFLVCAYSCFQSSMLLLSNFSQLSCAIRVAKILLFQQKCHRNCQRFLIAGIFYL